MSRILFLIALAALLAGANQCTSGTSRFEAEPNDNVATATVLASDPIPLDDNSPVRRGSVGGEDVDYWSIAVPPRARLTVSLDESPFPSPFSARGELSDTVVQILRPDGSIAASNDDDGPGFLSQLEVDTEGGGTWLICVMPFDPVNSHTIDYDLIVGVESYPFVRDELEPDFVIGLNDTPADAQPLQAVDARAVVVTGDLMWDDVDTYSFQVPSGKTIVATLFTHEPGPHDPVMRILDASEQPVAEDDDSGRGLMPNVSHVAGASGLYYVEIEPFLAQTSQREVANPVPTINGAIRTPSDFRYRLVVSLD